MMFQVLLNFWKIFFVLPVKSQENENDNKYNYNINDQIWVGTSMMITHKDTHLFTWQMPIVYLITQCC